MSMNAAADNISHLADALVGNYRSHFQLFCSGCWTEARVSRHAGDSLQDPEARRTAANHFYSVGWRFVGKTLCPRCATQEQT